MPKPAAVAAVVPLPSRGTVQRHARLLVTFARVVWLAAAAAARMGCAPDAYIEKGHARIQGFEPTLMATHAVWRFQDRDFREHLMPLWRERLECHLCCVEAEERRAMRPALEDATSRFKGRWQPGAVKLCHYQRIERDLVVFASLLPRLANVEPYPRATRRVKPAAVCK